MDFFCIFINDEDFTIIIVNELGNGYTCPEHSEELHNTIIEGVIKGYKTTGYPRNSYIRQMKSDVINKHITWIFDHIL